MRRWLGILSVALITPIIIVITVFSDFVVPIPVLSDSVKGKVVKSYYRYYGDYTECRCIIQFLDNGQPAEADIYWDYLDNENFIEPVVGQSVNILYNKDFMDYRATKTTSEEALLILVLWYCIEALVLFPMFIITVYLYRKKRRRERRLT